MLAFLFYLHASFYTITQTGDSLQPVWSPFIFFKWAIRNCHYVDFFLCLLKNVHDNPARISEAAGAFGRSAVMMGVISVWSEKQMRLRLSVDSDACCSWTFHHTVCVSVSVLPSERSVCDASSCVSLSPFAAAPQWIINLSHVWENGNIVHQKSVWVFERVCRPTASPVLDTLLSWLLLGSVWRNLPKLQLCLTRQFSSQGLSIIHIHESDVRGLLGAERSAKQPPGFFSPGPFLLNIFDRMSCLFFPDDVQPMLALVFHVEIHESNQQLHLERPDQDLLFSEAEVSRSERLFTGMLTVILLSLVLYPSFFCLSTAFPKDQLSIKHRSGSVLFFLMSSC